MHPEPSPGHLKYSGTMYPQPRKATCGPSSTQSSASRFPTKKRRTFQVEESSERKQPGTPTESQMPPTIQKKRQPKKKSAVEAWIVKQILRSKFGEYMWIPSESIGSVKTIWDPSKKGHFSSNSGRQWAVGSTCYIIYWHKHIYMYTIYSQKK